MEGSHERSRRNRSSSQREDHCRDEGHDGERTTPLRLIKNALKNKAIEKREMLTPAEEQQALATMVKQRRDSIEQYTNGNRPELAAKEASEIVVIEEFLPKALDEAGLAAIVKEVLAELAAASGKALTPKEMGTANQGCAGRSCKPPVCAPRAGPSVNW